MIGFPPDLTGYEGRCSKHAGANDAPKEPEAANDAALLTFTERPFFTPTKSRAASLSSFSSPNKSSSEKSMSIYASGALTSFPFMLLFPAFPTLASEIILPPLICVSFISVSFAAPIAMIFIPIILGVPNAPEPNIWQIRFNLKNQLEVSIANDDI
jgi:hypothetical protein